MHQVNSPSETIAGAYEYKYDQISTAGNYFVHSTNPKRPVMLMKILNIIFLLVFFSNTTYAQAPGIEWQKCYGGTQGESSYAIQQTSDGGYVVCGFTESYAGQITSAFSGRDMLIIKLDANGTLTWHTVVGGNGDDIALSIQETKTNGYIITGMTSSTNGMVTGNHGDYDYWVVALDNAGNFMWQKTYGGSGYDRANSIRETADGGYIIAGESNSTDGDITGSHGLYEAWIIKTGATGNIMWQRSYGGSGGESAREIKQTPDGGYIVAGHAASSDGDVINPSGAAGGAWILKLNASGGIEWQKLYGAPSGGQNANSVCLTSDGGYAITSVSYGSGGDVPVNYGYSDYWVMKLDATGNLSWQKSYGGQNHDEAYCIVQTIEGGYAIMGWTGSTTGDVTGHHGGSDYWVTKISSTGTLEWQKTMGGLNTDQGYSFSQATDQGYIISGYSGSNNTGDVTGNHGTNTNDIWIVKLKAGITYSTTNTEVCSSALPYIWNGNSYTTAGSYTVVLTGSDGFDSIPTINLGIKPSPEVQLGNDTSICIGKTLLLNASFPNASYIWQDGSSLSTHDISSEGIYWVNLSLNGCDKADTVAVDFKNCNHCKPSVPNAFTPNGDGNNDQWIITGNCGVPVNVSVYNRYGSLVYHSDNYGDDWKGTYKSKACPDGTYYYVIKLLYPNGNMETFKGNVTILR